MKTFEENFTAWVDGTLNSQERAKFEASLVSLQEAEAEKTAAQRLGSLIREHVPAPEMSNADFFNHQILRQIEERHSAPEQAKAGGIFWTLPRMAWAGAFCLAMAGAIYGVAVPKTVRQAAAGQEYVAKILNAETDDPAISATAYHDDDENVTVLWLGGLDYIPEDRLLR
ncbi:MAG: hypothetical protein QOD99_2257 [Chthoniobacter sp.]|jgi:anti-sigma factor RsiW|nr:hypothetical protein [Chthoniobacter sp.]